MAVLPVVFCLAFQRLVNSRLAVMFRAFSGGLGGSAVVFANLEILPLARSFRVFSGMCTWQIVLLWLLTVVPESSD